MAFDILEALRRMITLPKAKNSLSDIFGRDGAAVIVGTLHSVLSNAVVTALHGLTTSAIADLDVARTFVASAVTHALSDVSPSMAGQIATVVNGALNTVEQIAVDRIPDVATAIVGGISSALHIQDIQEDAPAPAPAPQNVQTRAQQVVVSPIAVDSANPETSAPEVDGDTPPPVPALPAGNY